jgi:hypothetical protein
MKKKAVEKRMRAEKALVKVHEVSVMKAFHFPF